MTKARGDRPLFLPDELSEDQMQKDLEQMLGQAGMHRYEISNYALPGRESRHNTGYWIRREYAGFGLGASGLIGSRRFRNTADLAEYISQEQPAREVTLLSRENEIEETMFLGLRMMEGVDLKRFEERFGVRAENLYKEVTETLTSQGLLETGEGHLRLTDRGIEVSNLVMAEFLL
jgi:oxygen-independent coproporphyrinogen-3 oxidase